MKMFVEPPAIYLHKQPVDFRKSINGLSIIVEEQMKLTCFSGALFVFCNRQRDKLKVLYWDKTGFCLWYKQYDVSPLLNKKMFAPLKSSELFKAVKVEQGGYAVFWNSEIDISEYELWKQGQPVS